MNQIKRNPVFIQYCYYRNEEERSGARANSISSIGCVKKRGSAGHNPVDRNGMAASPTSGDLGANPIGGRGNNIIT